MRFSSVTTTLFAAVVLVSVERREVTGLHGVVANASLQKSDERVPVGPVGAAGVPLERVRLCRLVDLNRVSHVVVVDVGRARDDLVRVIGLGSGLGIGLGLGLG